MVEEQEGANNDMSVLTVGRNGWWIHFQRRERLEKTQIGGGVGGGCRRKSRNPYPPGGPEASAKGGTVSLEVRSIY